MLITLQYCIGFAIHQHESEQTLGVSEGQESLASCSQGVRRFEYDLVTEQQQHS